MCSNPVRSVTFPEKKRWRKKKMEKKKEKKNNKE